MIARLQGILTESSFTNCIVSCGGVGYEVLIPLSTFDKLPRPGEECTLHIYTQVREDAVTLFGFAGKEDKELFKLLIGVSGIGGKLALNVLSSMPGAAFCEAVRSSDVKTLSRISGIGKKTAERMILELKEKVDCFASGTSAGGSVSAALSGSAAANDAALALETLGFKRDAIDKALRQALETLAGTGKEPDSEELLRKALLILNF